VAKRTADAYAPATVWHKIKNRAYTQMEGEASCSTRAGRKRTFRNGAGPAGQIHSWSVPFRAIDTHIGPETARGTRRLVVVPSPSEPLKFSPQQ
jgi:hypothetical protein